MAQLHLKALQATFEADRHPGQQAVAYLLKHSNTPAYLVELCEAITVACRADVADELPPPMPMQPEG